MIKFTSLVALTLFTKILFAQTWEWVDRITGNGNNHVFSIKADLEDSVFYCTGRVKNPGTFGVISSPQSPQYFGDRDIYLTQHDLQGNLNWVKRFGGTYTEYGRSIQIIDEYIYLMGFFTDTVIYEGVDTIVSAGGQDVLISKFDDSGNLIWMKTFGGLGNDQLLSSAIDEQGNIYFIGGFEDSINFNGIALLNTINPVSYPTTQASFIVKIDSSGSVQWAKKQQSTKVIEHLDIIYKDQHVYVSSGYNGNCEYYPGQSLLMNSSWWQASLLKITANGDFVWVNSYGGGYSEVLASLDFDSNNNLYAGGTYRGTAAFQTEILSSPNHYLENGMIIKFDTSGTVKDSYTFPSTNNGRVMDIKILDDKIYLGGYFTDSLFINGDTIIGNGDFDICLYALDTGMNYVWSSFQGGSLNDEIRSIDVFNNHQIIYGGAVHNISFPSISFVTPSNTYDAVMGLITPPLEARMAQNDTLFCNGQEVTIKNTSIGNINDVIWEYPGLDLVFQDDDSLIISSNVSGSFQIKLFVSNLSEEDSVYSKTIHFIELPQVNIFPDTIISCNGNIENVSANGYYDQLTWNTGEITENITISTTDWYIVTAINSGLCFVSDSVFVSFDETYPTINIIEDTLNGCINQQLVAKVEGDFDGIIWSDNTTLDSLLIDTEGWYFVVANNGGTCFNQDSVYANFNLLIPSLTLSASDTIFCTDETILISASGSFDSIAWFDNTTETIFSTSSTGYYGATVYAFNGCSNTDSIYVNAINCLNVSSNQNYLIEIVNNGNVIAQLFTNNVFTDYMLTDLSGKVIKIGKIEDEVIVINEILASGFYLLSTNTGESVKIFFKD